MIVEVRIEKNNKPLLFSLNLGFIRDDPNHPKKIKLVYKDENKTCEVESMQFERDDIIIQERQQTVTENCDGWKRQYVAYIKQQSQLVDGLFDENNNNKVRTFRNLSASEIDNFDLDGYAYKLGALKNENGHQIYKSVDEHFYVPNHSETSSPRMLENTPELLSNCSLESFDDQNSDNNSTINSMEFVSSAISEQTSQSSEYSKSNQPTPKKSKIGTSENHIDDKATNVLEHFNWHRKSDENFNIEIDNSIQEKTWMSRKEARMVKLKLSVPKIINEQTPLVLFFPEKGCDDIFQYDNGENDALKYVKNSMYVLSLQNPWAQKWTSLIDTDRMKKIMEEIKTMFTKDNVITIGINRGAYQTLVSYLDVPDVSKILFLYNPYLNTRSNSQISTGYKNRLIKILKTEQTQFYIGVNKSKRVEPRTRIIVEIMKEHATMVHSKLYKTMEELLQDQLMVTKEYDENNVTAISYLTNKINKVQHSC